MMHGCSTNTLTLQKCKELNHHYMRLLQKKPLAAGMMSLIENLGIALKISSDEDVSTGIGTNLDTTI